MTGTRKAILTASLLVPLAACAPSFGPGLNLGLGVGPALNLNVSRCSLMGGPTPEMTASGSSNAAIQVGQIRSQIAQIQSKFSFGYGDPRTAQSSWKRLAEGGC